eukprot:scaffold78169_cov50-Cyclotella_meneghiniana.AAC.3
MALGERGRGKRGDDGDRSKASSEVGVRRGYRFLRRGAGPLEEGYEWCPPSIIVLLGTHITHYLMRSIVSITNIRHYGCRRRYESEAIPNLLPRKPSMRHAERYL